MGMKTGMTAGWALCFAFAAVASAGAVDIAPHRALYSMSLSSAKSNSGVAAANGSMVYQWGETCEGWTIEQRYRLRMFYAQGPDVELTSNFVTWESKDGLRYRFNERKLRNGQVDEEVRGEARLEGPGQGGVVEFIKPETTKLDLAPGVLFPTAHTLMLLERAMAGESFFSRQVFDGASFENAVQITAVIGAEQTPEEAARRAGSNGDGIRSPLLERPSWRVRMAFFSADSKIESPEYELGMRLLDNGVSRELSLDYGDFVIRAKLDELEPLPKPNC